MSHNAWEERTGKLHVQAVAHEYYLKRKAHNTAIVKEYLLNGCAVCGEMQPALLEFHHKDPKTKVRTIKSSLGRSTKHLEIELAKCVVLCMQCHYNVHYKEAMLPQ